MFAVIEIYSQQGRSRAARNGQFCINMYKIRFFSPFSPYNFRFIFNDRIKPSSPLNIAEDSETECYQIIFSLFIKISQAAENPFLQKIFLNNR